MGAHYVMPGQTIFSCFDARPKCLFLSRGPKNAKKLQISKFWGLWHSIHVSKKISGKCDGHNMEVDKILLIYLNLGAQELKTTSSRVISH